MTKTVELCAPEAWANALTYGDYTGLDSRDRVAIEGFLQSEQVSPHDCVDSYAAGFVWRHDAFMFMPVGANCQNYVFVCD